MTHPGDCEADAASTALAPYRPGTAARVAVIPVTQVGVQGSQLDRNCRIYPKRVWFGKGPGRAGGKDEVQKEGVQVQKKGSHLQKKCSKVQ